MRRFPRDDRRTAELVECDGAGSETSGARGLHERPGGAPTQIQQVQGTGAVKSVEMFSRCCFCNVLLHFFIF